MTDARRLSARLREAAILEVGRAKVGLPARTSVAALLSDAARLAEWVESVAAEKMCADEPDKCYLDSGPYCGSHWFDEEHIKAARALLIGRGGVDA